MARSALCQLREPLARFAVLNFRKRTDPQGRPLSCFPTYSLPPFFRSFLFGRDLAQRPCYHRLTGEYFISGNLPFRHLAS